MSQFKVSHMEEGLAEVVDPATRRWWSVSAPNKSGERFIMADNGRPISSGGATGRKLIAAVDEFEAGR